MVPSKKKILIGFLVVIALILATNKDIAITLINFVVGLLAVIFGQA